MEFGELEGEAAKRRATENFPLPEELKSWMADGPCSGRGIGRLLPMLELESAYGGTTTTLGLNKREVERRKCRNATGAIIL